MNSVGTRPAMAQVAAPATNTPAVAHASEERVSFAEASARVRSLRQRAAIIDHLQTSVMENFFPRGELDDQPTHVVQLGGELVTADEDVVIALSDELADEAQRVREQIHVLNTMAFTIAKLETSTLFPPGLPSNDLPVQEQDRHESVLPNPAASKKQQKQPAG